MSLRNLKKKKYFAYPKIVSAEAKIKEIENSIELLTRKEQEEFFIIKATFFNFNI